MISVYLLLSFSIYLCPEVNGNSESVHTTILPQKPYDELFANAMDAYRDKNHSQTVLLIHEAIADYEYAREITAQCWLKCQAEFTKSKMLYVSILDGQLNFLHYTIKMKACSEQCKKKFLGERKDVNEKTKDFFKQREPYKFMQYSYTQIGDWEKALQTAYTYLEAHPENQNMRDNVGSLMKKAGTLAEDLQSLDEPRHITLYRLGEVAYFSKNYSATIEYFEESHTLFFKEVEKCIGLCEEELEVKKMFHSNKLFNYYRELIACRQACRTSLTTGKTDTPPEKFVPLYYDFLQFAYFQLKKPLEAARVTYTYLFLIPDEDKMKQNLKFYQTQPGVKGKPLKPRPSAVKFYRQLSLESSLIVIAKGLVQPYEALNDKLLDKQARDEIENVHESVLREISQKKGPAKGDEETRLENGKPQDDNRHYIPRAYRDQGRWRNNPEISHVKLLMEENELNGTDRVVFDEVVNDSTCKKLTTLVQKIAIDGDGYQHSHKDAMHPFTDKEEFKGVSVGKFVEAYEEGRISFEDAELFFNITERVRLLTQEYFNLARLNIAYSHLVCRHAIPDLVKTDEEHISHPIHSDNCVVGGDGPGTCPKRDPAYTWRDYSSLLYLNDDFTGGEFVFADYKKQITARLTPTCGRGVAFRSYGIHNLHGVIGVKSGVRCALAQWFTLSNVSEDERRKHEARMRVEKQRRDTESKHKKNEL